MGCRAYAGNDVKQGLDGFAKVTPPTWTGWRKPIWCQLYACNVPQSGWESGVSVFGWEDPHSSKPSVLDWVEFSKADQERLLATIEAEYHWLFPLKAN